MTMPIRRVIYLQWTSLLAVSAISLAAGTIPLAVQLVPLLISMVLVGLPHGAVDHRVIGWVEDRSLTLLEMSRFLGGYILLVGVVLLLWIVAPLAAFIFFILLTWWHWGLGDLHAIVDYTGGSFLTSPALRGVSAVLRGGFPMLVPLIFFPDDYRLAASEIIALFDAAAPVPTIIFTPVSRATLFAALLSIIVVLLVRTWFIARRQDAMPAWYRYASETGLLLIFFATVPPFLAVGIYFCVWHSVRHIIRMIDIQTTTAEADPISTLDSAAVWRFTVQAAPLTIAALLMLGALYVVFPQAQRDSLSLVSLYLALIAGLTLPHTLVVMWLDHQQRIWQPSLR